MPPFAIKDCALLALATSRKVHTLNEFRDALYTITPASIYYHFWGGLLQPRFEEREFNNDFAGWVRHELHDTTLAERLAVLDPVAYPDIEGLRSELIDLVETRLDESAYLSWMRALRPFEFVRSQIVVFDTGETVHDPVALARKLRHLSTGSLFYHFIDARRRSPSSTDDFCAWLADHEGCDHLIRTLSEVDPYFAPLSEVRGRLVELFARHFNLEPPL